MHESLNGYPYPMGPPSPHIGPHGTESRLGAAEARIETLHGNQGEIFGLLRVLDRRVTAVEAERAAARSSHLSKPPGRLAAATELIRVAAPPLRDMIWAVLVLLIGLGMITLDQAPAISITAPAPFGSPGK